MTSPARMLNSAAWFVPEGEGGGLAADATYITGAIVDRAAFGMPRSAIAVCGVVFTTAGGVAGATNTLAFEVLDDTAAGMGTAAAYDSDSYVYTWAANGDNVGFHTMPLDLDEANQYIRARAKLTESGTVTITKQYLTVGLLLGGMNEVPHSSYAAAGTETTTEPS